MQTNIEEVEIDNLDDFGTGSASLDVDPPGKTTPADEGDEKDKTELGDDKKTIFSVDDSLIPTLAELEGEEEEEEVEEGAEKKSKTASPVTAKAIGSLIKKGVLKPFVDESGKEESMDKYTDSDYEDLIKSNIEQIEERTRAELQNSFFNEMPEEFALAYNYIQKGGTDIKGLFKMFAENAETFETDTTNEEDAESITRSYMKLTNFGTDDEIEEQVKEWKELNVLNKKADMFKPKLQEVKQKQIAKKLADQEADRQKRIQAIDKFQNNVVSALKTGELNGIKIDRKTQSTLYQGIVNLDYDSLTGRKVNLLGHLLEKYQFVEPKLDLISEVLWLLQDPTGYKEKIKALGGKATVAETVRQLKTAESEKKTTAIIEDEPDETSRSPKKNFKPRSIFG